MSQQINLFRAEFRKPRDLLSATTVVAAVLLLVAAALGYAGYADSELKEVENRIELTEFGLNQIREQLTGLGAGPAQAGPSKALLDELARTEASIKIRQDLIEALKGGGIGSAEGYSRYLAALARQRAEGVWLTGVKMSGAGADFTIQGRVLRADLLPGYIQLLNREEALRGKQIGQMNLLERTQDAAASPAPVPGGTGAQRGPAAGDASHVRYVEFTIGSGAATAGAGG
jgi:hypothetical protein